MSFCQKKPSNKQKKEREKQTQQIVLFFSFVSLLIQCFACCFSVCVHCLFLCSSLCSVVLCFSVSHSCSVLFLVSSVVFVSLCLVFGTVFSVVLNKIRSFLNKLWPKSETNLEILENSNKTNRNKNMKQKLKKRFV